MAGRHNGDADVQTQTGLPGGDAFGAVTESDVRPAWETDGLPDWVVHWLVPMLMAGQAWPRASESGLWGIRQAQLDVVRVLASSFGPASEAARAISDAWESPAKGPAFLRLEGLFDDRDGALAKMTTAHTFARQADAFAVSTQHSKLSINVAFWVSAVAVSIALLASAYVWSARILVERAGLAGNSAVSRILAGLVEAGGRRFVTRLTTTLAGGQAGRRLLSWALLEEVGEEVAEETFIEMWAQGQQLRMGTRLRWDWKQIWAAGLGAATGAVVGYKLAGPIAGLTGRLPGVRHLNRAAGDAHGLGNALRRLPGRMLNTGLNNMVASPAGSLLTQVAVYHQRPTLSLDQLVGGFMGAAGRVNSVSPFHVSVARAAVHPLDTLSAPFLDAAFAGTHGPPDSPGSSSGGRDPGAGGPSQNGHPPAGADTGGAAAPVLLDGNASIPRPVPGSVADPFPAKPPSPHTAPVVHAPPPGGTPALPGAGPDPGGTHAGTRSGHDSTAASPASTDATSAGATSTGAASVSPAFASPADGAAPEASHRPAAPGADRPASVPVQHAASAAAPGHAAPPTAPGPGDGSPAPMAGPPAAAPHEAAPHGAAPHEAGSQQNGSHVAGAREAGVGTTAAAVHPHPGAGGGIGGDAMIGAMTALGLDHTVADPRARNAPEAAAMVHRFTPPPGPTGTPRPGPAGSPRPGPGTGPQGGRPDDAARQTLTYLVNATASAKEPDDAHLVNTGWKSWDRATQERLIREHPELVGRLNGVPALARHQANRILLRRRLDELERDWQAADDAERDRIGDAYRGLRRLESLLDGDADLRLLDLRLPSARGEAGHVVVAVGDTDTAQRVEAYVPRRQHGLANLDTYLERAEGLRPGADGRQAAAVLWLGLAPRPTAGGVPSDPARPADENAGLVTGLLAGLRGAHAGPVPAVLNLRGDGWLTAARAREHGAAALVDNPGDMRLDEPLLASELTEDSPGPAHPARADLRVVRPEDLDHATRRPSLNMDAPSVLGALYGTALDPRETPHADQWEGLRQQVRPWPLQPHVLNPRATAAEVRTFAVDWRGRTWPIFEYTMRIRYRADPGVSAEEIATFHANLLEAADRWYNHQYRLPPSHGEPEALFHLRVEFEQAPDSAGDDQVVRLHSGTDHRLGELADPGVWHHAGEAITTPVDQVRQSARRREAPITELSWRTTMPQVVIAHELGHRLAGLSDDYVKDGTVRTHVGSPPVFANRNIMDGARLFWADGNVLLDARGDAVPELVGLRRDHLAALAALRAAGDAYPHLGALSPGRPAEEWRRPPYVPGWNLPPHVAELLRRFPVPAGRSALDHVRLLDRAHAVHRDTLDDAGQYTPEHLDFTDALVRAAQRLYDTGPEYSFRRADLLSLAALSRLAFPGETPDADRLRDFTARTLGRQVNKGDVHLVARTALDVGGLLPFSSEQERGDAVALLGRLARSHSGQTGVRPAGPSPARAATPGEPGNGHASGGNAEDGNAEDGNRIDRLINAAPDPRAPAPAGPAARAEAAMREAGVLDDLGPRFRSTAEDRRALRTLFGEEGFEQWERGLAEAWARAGEEELRAWAPVRAAMPVEDQVALLAFLGHDERFVNGPLRFGWSERVAELAPLLRCLRSAVNALPVFAGPVFTRVRVLPGDMAQLAVYEEGAVVREPAFVVAVDDRARLPDGNVEIGIDSAGGRRLPPWFAGTSVVFPNDTHFKVLAAGPGEIMLRELADVAEKGPLALREAGDDDLAGRIDRYLDEHAGELPPAARLPAGWTRRQVVEAVTRAALVMVDEVTWRGGSQSDVAAGGRIKETTVWGHPNHYARWVNGTGPEPGPADTMNCWESVLFSAYKAGVISKSALRRIADDMGAAAVAAAAQPGNGELDVIAAGMAVVKWHMSPGPLTRYESGGPAVPEGHIVFMDHSNHVMISLGTRDEHGRQEVLSHWIYPDREPAEQTWLPWVTRGTVKRTTVEEVMVAAGLGDDTLVESGPPPWLTDDMERAR
ncbi:MULTISPECIES: hypothetical protein [unclassified Nonomuraea]|uniref:hypothetical protein n=1 Tax=unclassified Nonomuraea TaxID=2593643 RepID=UPI0033D294F2